MQLRLKKDISYQPSPQKNVEEKWREGEKSSFDRIGLEKVKCAGNEAQLRVKFHYEINFSIMKSIFHMTGRQLCTWTPEDQQWKMCVLILFLDMPPLTACHSTHFPIKASGKKE